jgi:hypothetical protein
MGRITVRLVASLETVGAVPLSDMAGELRHAAVGIPLRARNGAVRAFAMVDAEDFAWLSTFKWSLTRSKRSPYARRHQPGTDNGTIWMHRQIMGLPDDHDGRDTDHISGDGLDNRKANLRVVTRSQNLQNTNGWRNSSSQYRGVSWDKRDRRWTAYGWLDGKKKHIGSFKDEHDAGLAAAEWRRNNLTHSND